MLYLGIDGGGSGCRAVLADASGRVIARAEGGPANIASDFDGALATLRATIATVCAGQEGALRAVLGLAGTNLSGAGARLEAALPFPARVVQDVTTSVRGALGRADGIVAALGTGSVFARQTGGEIRAIGGWGLRLGDEGSGAWIGRAALSHVTRVLDGYFPATDLTAALVAEFGGGPGVVRFSLTATPADFAALVPRILAAAQAGDPAAEAVIGAARAEIRRAIALLQPEAPLPVTWIGGLGAALAVKDWATRPALGTALDGALALAMDETTWTE
ncbi:MAG: BadF/BadG/BcrA/BcrD ATPase family protein [Paenirhodobacter sp.]|uniref:BadF/BadG/BcrA/BcrD ATPase family protein n=1 Tax=Paenirhodobacter sp. TaxID=1965326 RepID=UPI003D148103